MTEEQERFADLNGSKLQEWLIAEIGNALQLRSAEKFAGGQSNPTYLLETSLGRMVLRRKPFGTLLPSAHAVEREYKLLTALHPSNAPTPEPIALCEDISVIGSAFYVMSMVEGQTFWNGALPGLTPGNRREVYLAMIDALADLHTIDAASVGLSDYGAPGDYFARQVGRWTKQYRASQTDEIGEVEQLIEWLPDSMPKQERSSIIHGDYRIDNLIYAPGSNTLLAIIDWELSTLGDPLADFAYLAMNWAMPHGQRGAQLAGLDLESLGIPTLDEITQRYCSATGRETIPDLNWFFAYNLFRLVGILQGIKKRAIDGNASSANATNATARIEPLARQAWAFAQQAQT